MRRLRITVHDAFFPDQDSNVVLRLNIDQIFMRFDHIYIRTLKRRYQHNYIGMRIVFLTLIFAWALVTQVDAQISWPPSADNQTAKVSQLMGLVEASVKYSRPNVHSPTGEDRKGKIWGTLIPYGENVPFPWRLGANERTVIEFSHDVVIDNHEVKAGRYGLMAYIEEKAPWTIIISKEPAGWGAYSYKKEDDLVRIKVMPTDCEYTEWLTFGFDNPSMESTDLFMRWENKEFRFPIKVKDYVGLYVEHFRKALKESPALFYSQNWEWAADFCVDHDVNLEEALRWANMSMTPGIGEETFTKLQTKAKIFKKLGKQAEADAAMDKAVASTTASVHQVDNYARNLLSENRSERALTMFKLNEKKFPDQKYLTSLGLADYYVHVKEKKNEVKYVKLAIEHLPEHRKSSLPDLQARLK